MRIRNICMFSLLMCALCVSSIAAIEVGHANPLGRYQSAYDSSATVRRSNFESILTTSGYLRPIVLRAISADSAPKLPGVYTKPGLYTDRKSDAAADAKKNFDSSFIGIGIDGGNVFSLLLGDGILDDDESYVVDDEYDDDDATDLAGAKFLGVYVLLIILITLVKGYVAKLLGRNNKSEEKKAGGFISCLGLGFWYVIVPFGIVISMLFIPWKPSPDMRHAAAMGDVAQIQARINDGEDININTNTGVWTPLAYAADQGHLAAVQELLKHNPALYLTPLVAAADNGHKAVCEALLKDARYGAWLASQTKQLFEVFNAAAKDDNVAMLDYLYSVPLLKSAPNVLNNALVEASLKGQMKAVDWLLAKGANVNFATPFDGFTPLMMAAATNNQALVKKYLELGANANARTRMTQETAYSVAASHGYGAIAKVLDVE